MAKLTRWEKNMQRHGYDIIPFTHEEIVDHLLDVFHRDQSHLLTQAAADPTKRHTLCFILDYCNIGEASTIFGGTVIYDKKKRRFSHIQYSDSHNWAVMFSIETKVAYFAYEFWKPLIKIQPFWSIKKLTKYLLTH